MSDITEEMLERFRKSYEGDPGARVLNAAEAKTPLSDLAFIPMNAARLSGDFTIELKTHGITAQQKSGRCWMFAALNILREKVIEKCDLKDFELSQNYLTFYDKLEKANNFLDLAIEHAGDDWNSRFMSYLTLLGVDDGGYWGEAVDLIKKYGAVPKNVNPESYQSEHTETFMKQLNLLLKKDASILRQMARDGKDPEETKTEMLGEVYKALAIAFGEPVKTFDFEYRDKEDVFHIERNLTPKDFYDRYIGADLDEYVALDAEPFSNRPVNTPVVVHSICNMSSRDLFALNVSEKDMEALCLAQLKEGEPVWFACDAGAHGARKEGIWDPDSVSYEGLLGGVDLYMEKQARLEYHASGATHAMMLAGVSLDADGNPTKWKIENSWGKENGKDGYYVCSEKYFEEYVYEAVIKKSLLSEAQRQMLTKEPVRLEPWEEG